MSLRDGLTHRWEFEEDTGPILDLEGSSDLTIIGTQIPSVPGRIGQAGDFRTTQSYAHLQASAGGLDGVDALSVATWIWLPVSPGVSRRAWVTQTGTAALIRASIGPTNIPFVQMFNTGETITTTAPSAFTAENWVHLGYTFERGVGAVLYMNGSAVVSAPQTVSEATRTGGSLALNMQARDGTGNGLGAGSEKLAGMQDQFVIYDRAIDATEMSAIWNGGLGVDFDNLAEGIIVAGDLLSFGAVNDVYPQGLVPKNIRFVPGATSVAGDVIQLVDPVTSEVLYDAILGANVEEKVEEIAVGGVLSTWPNGVKVGTLTGNRGTVYIRYA